MQRLGLADRPSLCPTAPYLSPGVFASQGRRLKPLTCAPRSAMPSKLARPIQYGGQGSLWHCVRLLNTYISQHKSQCISAAAAAFRLRDDEDMTDVLLRDDTAAVVDIQPDLLVSGKLFGGACLRRRGRDDQGVSPPDKRPCAPRRLERFGYTHHRDQLREVPENGMSGGSSQGSLDLAWMQV